MGGVASGVTDGTTSVVLESAEFGPGLTRESARGLGIETDASLRFVQGVDPEGVPIALDDVARILSETAGGEVVREVLDRWPGRKAPPRITLRLARARALLGIDVAPARAGSALAGLGIRQVDPWTGEGISATAAFEVPSHRRDLELEVDLIEEVARVVGYDTIPSRLDRVSIGTSPIGATGAIVNDILAIACGIGFDEIVNTALIGALPDAWMPAEGPGALWEVRNPKSKELRHLRPSLLPGLLAAAGRNLRHGAGEVRLVEAGKIFSALPPPLGSERIELALILGGAPDSWSHPGADADRFLELKGSAESLLGSLGIDSPRTRPYHEPCWAPGTGIRLEHDEVALGRLGEVAGEIRALLQIDRRLWAAAFDLAAVERAIPARRQYRAIHRFPPSKRDLALVVGQEVAYASLVEAIGLAGGSLLHQVRLFDVFEGPQVGVGKKSLAFALEFRSADRTLSDGEVDETVERIVKDLAARFGASRRGGVVEPARAGQPIA
jgi:phenylalanyl-tRNA synthetase beta chain